MRPEGSRRSHLAPAERARDVPDGPVASPAGPLDAERTRRALRFAERAHRGRLGRDGTRPYLCHVTAVVRYAVEAGLADPLVCAAYLALGDALLARLEAPTLRDGLAERLDRLRTIVADDGIRPRGGFNRKARATRSSRATPAARRRPA
jgi:hypothetical protein